MKKLILKDTQTSAGRGIFTDGIIKSGTLVETSPVSIFIQPLQDIIAQGQDGVTRIITHQLPTGISDIYFSWGYMTAQPEYIKCIALGLGSLFNHSDIANLRYEADLKNMNMLFFSVRDIYIGEQLTINYNGEKGHHLSDKKKDFKNGKHNF